MERFTIIHDGSAQGWRTAYLAFHIAGRLGAPLQVLLASSAAGEDLLHQTASEVEVGGRAAGLIVRTRVLPNISLQTIIENIEDATGLFLPHRLVPDPETAARFIGATVCPLWVVSGGSAWRAMALLVEDPAAETEFIAYAAALAQRMDKILTALALENGLPSADDPRLDWITLQDFSFPVVAEALNRLQADLVFLRPSQATLLHELDCTCIVVPRR